MKNKTLITEIKKLINEFETNKIKTYLAGIPFGFIDKHNNKIQCQTTNILIINGILYADTNVNERVNVEKQIYPKSYKTWFLEFLRDELKTTLTCYKELERFN